MSSTIKPPATASAATASAATASAATANDELLYALQRSADSDDFSDFLQTLIRESPEVDQEEQRASDSQVLVLPLRKWNNHQAAAQSYQRPARLPSGNGCALGQIESGRQ